MILTTNSNSNSNPNFLQQEDYPTTTNNNNQNKQPSSSSSSCCSYPSSSTSSFSSSDIHLTAASTSSSSLLVDVDPKTPKSTTATTVFQDSEAEAILVKLKNPQISVKESGLVTLRHSARESSQRRISLCTPTLLSALVPMILSTNSTIQINATAALVNLSIDPANKVKIVRSGAVPPLVEALRSTATNHSEEARYNAAGALFSLALQDENKLAIGVLGAIPPLVNLFCQAQQQVAVAGHDVACVEAGMALYHLSLAPNNLSKIARTAGAVKSILTLATTNVNAAGAVKEETEEEEGTIRLRLRRVAMMLLASLARRNEGRVALMDADTVKVMVEMMKQGAAAGREEEYCLAVMYEMSKGSLRFRALARAAGAERVLLAMTGNNNEEGRGEVGKEMARRTLKVIRGDEEKGVMLMLGDEYDNEGEEEVGSVVSDGLVSFRRRYDDFGGGSGANSANF